MKKYNPKKIKSGDILVKKVDRNYVTNAKNLPEILGRTLSGKNKKEIDEAVSRVAAEYGETLKLLGRES